MPVSTLYGSSSEVTFTPKPDILDTEPENIDPEVLKSLVEKLVEDEQATFILAWLQMARMPLHIRALETAVALFTKPECGIQEELNDYRPGLSEELITETMGAFIKIVNGNVSFKNDAVTEYFAAHPPLHASSFSDIESLKFSIAKACVTYLALEDFRDLPLPVRIKGHRYDLEASDPFLTYASCNWHKHIRSVVDARPLEPWLDRVIDPAQNNVYLWTDQSSGGSSSGGPRHFFRSRAEIAIKYDIQWLAAYLLESTSSELEDMFPAKDLPWITREAPSILKFLLDRKPEYYRPAINRKVFMEAASWENGSLETLQILLANESDLRLPAAFLRSVAQNRNGDQLFDFLFGVKEDLPITHRVLSEAAANQESGGKILKQCFEKDLSIRVDAHMIAGAIFARNSSNLRLLFEHDPDAPIDGSTLESVMRMELKPEKLNFLLSVKPDVPIPPNVVELAVKLNRDGAVKLLFDTHEDLKVTEEIIKTAAGSEGHELEMTEYLLERCDPEFITEDVLITGCCRSNSADKMVALLLRYNTELQVSDEMLTVSGHDWDGKVLDLLLKQRGGQEVPNKLVDMAVSTEKTRLSWTWRNPKEDHPSLLRTLRQRVPNDPYLKKIMAETDFTPPAPKSPNRTPRPTDLPDAAKTSDLAQLKSLLDQCIDVNTTHGSTCSCDRNKGHGTALQRAVKQRDVEMAKVLIEHGANLDLQDGAFGNPLQEASKAGDMDLVKLLVEHKADVNLEGGRFRSPLIAAAKADDAKIVRYLVENGADINIADADGWTPYLHAVACGSRDAARALLDVDSSLPALGELIALPPTRFRKVDGQSTVGISEDGLTINTDTADAAELSRRILLRADHPIVPTSPFYFEITIIRIGGDGIIGLGLSTPKSLKQKQTGLPGWTGGSWGYHGDDGHTMDEGDHYLRAPYPTYGAGDVIGCGYDLVSRSMYFTKNGVRLGDEAFHMIEADLLIPVIGIGSDGTEVAVNFGDQGAFVYLG